MLWLALLGCPKPVVDTVDPTLPEANESVEAREPLVVLAEVAANPNPGPRSWALAYLVAAASEPAGGEWGERALWDPDGWVQRRAGLALAARPDDPAAVELLVGWIARPTADPYARGAVALRMLEHPEVGPAVRAALAAESSRWRQAPLALAAGAFGDEEATDVLVEALARGDIALEPRFMEDLGRHPVPSVRAAVAAGAERVEEELQLAYGAARLRLGDAAGEQVLRRALDAEPVGRRLEAVELATRVDHPAATALLRKAAGTRDPLVRALGELGLALRDDDASDAFVTHASHPDAEVRTRVQELIVQRAERPLTKKVRKLLESVVRAGRADRHPSVRAAAVQAGAALGMDPAIAREALTDAGPFSRLHAAGWLAQ
jgi:hypothetical protein